MSKALGTIKSIFLNLYFLVFINGFLLAFFIFCRVQADYENRLFADVASIVTRGEEQSGQGNLIKTAVKITNRLLQRRSDVFNGQAPGGFLDDMIHPLSADMMTAEGACGSYSAVLCRVLNTMGITTRIAQMKVNGKYGGHIITEAKTANGWVVLDPLYNLYFTRPDGKMAGFSEVSSMWQWYKKQVPADYNPSYNYAGVQYTNWNKIPVVMPAVKMLLAFFIKKEQLETISLRSYFLEKYTVAANVLLLFILPLSVLIVVKLAQLKYHTPQLLTPQSLRGLVTFISPLKGE